jgi:hypothetical protein
MEFKDKVWVLRDRYHNMECINNKVSNQDMKDIKRMYYAKNMEERINHNKFKKKEKTFYSDRTFKQVDKV